MQTLSEQTTLYKHKAKYNVTNFKQSIATKQAIAYSIKYGTFWYVRKFGENNYMAYAHSCNSSATVACFYNGEDWTDI